MGTPNHIGSDIFEGCINLKEFSCPIPKAIWNNLAYNTNSRSLGWADHSNVEIVHLIDGDIIVSD